MNPKVSVVTPAYNAAAQLPEAISSVRAQTCTDWEMIVVNDGSTDGTASLLDAQDDPRIRVIDQANSGVSAARNAGLDAAQGDYLTFLDADDVLPPGALAVRAQFLDAHPTVDIVNGGVHVTAGGRTLRQYRPDLTQGPMTRRLARLEEGVFFGPFYMLRRHRIGSQRFPVGITHCEDLIFFLSLAESASLRYGAVADIVYEYRVTPGSAMSDLDGIETGYLEFLRCSARLAGIDAATRSYQLRRVRQILFRSWLRRGRPFRALGAVLRVARLQNVVSADTGF